MSDPYTALAAILDRGSPAQEAEALLGAIVDGGVYVPPIDNQGSPTALLAPR